MASDLFFIKAWIFRYHGTEYRLLLLINTSKSIHSILSLPDSFLIPTSCAHSLLLNYTLSPILPIHIHHAIRSNLRRHHGRRDLRFCLPYATGRCVRKAKYPTRHQPKQELQQSLRKLLLRSRQTTQCLRQRWVFPVCRRQVHCRYLWYP